MAAGIKGFTRTDSWKHPCCLISSLPTIQPYINIVDNITSKKEPQRSDEATRSPNPAHLETITTNPPKGQAIPTFERVHTREVARQFPLGKRLLDQKNEYAKQVGAEARGGGGEGILGGIVGLYQPTPGVSERLYCIVNVARTEP